MKFLNIAEKDDTAEVMMYGSIGWDVEARDFVDRIKAIKSPKISLRIHSDGGSVFDGWAMHETLRNHPAHVTAYVDGIAASMASVIMMAADKVVMAKNALVMIHDPVACMCGREEDMRRAADLLSIIKDQIRKAYAERSGMSEDDVAEMMADETWMDAQEAVRLGFADEISGKEMQMAAHFEIGYTPKNKREVNTMEAENKAAEIKAEYDKKFEEVKAEAQAKVTELSAQVEAARSEIAQAKAETETITAKLTDAEARATEAEAKATDAEAKAEEATTRLKALSGGLQGDDSTPVVGQFKTAEAAIDHYMETMDYSEALDKVRAEHAKLYDAWLDNATNANPHR